MKLSAHLRKPDCLTPEEVSEAIACSEKPSYAVIYIPSSSSSSYSSESSSSSKSRLASCNISNLSESGVMFGQKAYLTVRTRPHHQLLLLLIRLIRPNLLLPLLPHPNHAYLIKWLARDLTHEPPMKGVLLKGLSSSSSESISASSSSR